MTDTSAAPPAADFDVLGIGNALVDVLSRENDAFIDRLSLERGAMTLIDTERAEELYAAMGTKTEMSGGSAANTLAGVASFGGRSAYIGRVRDDLSARCSPTICRSSASTSPRRPPPTAIRRAAA